MKALKIRELELVKYNSLKRIMFISRKLKEAHFNLKKPYESFKGVNSYTVLFLQEDYKGELMTI